MCGVDGSAGAEHMLHEVMMGEHSLSAQCMRRQGIYDADTAHAARGNGEDAAVAQHMLVEMGRTVRPRRSTRCVHWGRDTEGTAHSA